MDKLPTNLKEVFYFLNWFLIMAHMVTLYHGVKKFRQVPLAGSWFRWRAFGYTLLIFGADLVAAYFVWQGDPFFLAIRLTIARVVHLWETLYCFNYRYDRLSDVMRYALTHPWVLDQHIPTYVPVTSRVAAWLSKVLKRLHRRMCRLPLKLRPSKKT